MQERVRVGAAQVAPHFFHRRRTPEKTVRVIEEADRFGLDLLVFPETYFDCMGHYSRFDLLSLNVREHAWTPFGTASGPAGAGRQTVEGSGAGSVSGPTNPGEISGEPHSR